VARRLIDAGRVPEPAVAVFTMADYVAAGIITEAQAEGLRLGMTTRANILVAGGTSTEKTPLTNALLAAVMKTDDRVVIIEDTRELQCTAPNLVAMRNTDRVASLSDLVRFSLRLRPDCIPLARCAGARRLICSRLGAPAIRASWAPFMQAPPSGRCAEWSSSLRRRW
tara:strand:+ start:358 stop:861 length:504 start_codon:yes stop_codon:yes gene_type:complete